MFPNKDSLDEREDDLDYDDLETAKDDDLHFGDGLEDDFGQGVDTHYLESDVMMVIHSIINKLAWARCERLRRATTSICHSKSPGRLHMG